MYDVIYLFIIFSYTLFLTGPIKTEKCFMCIIILGSEGFFFNEVDGYPFECKSCFFGRKLGFKLNETLQIH